MIPLLPPRALAPLEEHDRTRVQAIMEKARQIEIRIRGLVDSSLAGSYHAAFRGRGIDFERVREYVPGDEVRTIDWNVTARAGRPCVKQFREERELTTTLLVDVSASGNFGSQDVQKRELAAELACVLAMSAIRNNDLVGLVMFSDRIERYVPPSKGRTHALRIVREILGCKPEGRGTEVASALQLAGHMVHRRSVMFLISDLEVGPRRHEALAALQRAARPLGKRHEIVALHLRDPHEFTLPDVGLLTLEDAETGEVISIDTRRRKLREKFAKLAMKRAAEVELLLRRSNIDTLAIDTSRPYVPVLLEFFAGRERGLR